MKMLFVVFCNFLGLFDYRKAVREHLIAANFYGVDLDTALDYCLISLWSINLTLFSSNEIIQVYEDK